MAKTLVVGLTGGIGSGKTAVARLLSHFDVRIIDADVIARHLTNSDQKLLAELRKEFGSSIFDNSRHLLRHRLAEIVFANNDALRKLNAIIHPRVLKVIDHQVTKYTEEEYPIVVVDAALIYEAGVERKFHYVIVVFAPLEQRLARLHQRYGLKYENLLPRIRAQIPLEEKVKRADYVVNNSGPLFGLRHQVRSLYFWLQDKRYIS